MSRKRNRHAPRKPAPAAPQAGGGAAVQPVPGQAIEDQADEPQATAEQGAVEQVVAEQAVAEQVVAEQVAEQPEASSASTHQVDSTPDAQPDARAPAEPRRARAPRVHKHSADTREPFAILLDYEDRSLRHVAGLPEQIDAPGLWRGVGYRVGSRRLASGFGEVVEILPMPQVTHVPGAQPWMLGVANVRGNLLPIVDLKQFLEGERTVLHEGQRMLVVRQSGGDVAITVDELYGQRSFVEEQRIDTEGAEAKPGVALAAGRYAHLIERAYRIDGTTWGVLSLDLLSRTPEFRQAAA
jgi:twitching motility protein PilI